MSENLHLPTIKQKASPASAPGLSLEVPPLGGSPQRSRSARKQHASPSKTLTPEDVKLPTYMAVYENPPQAAGVPIMELIRKLEEERVLSRNDRTVCGPSLLRPRPHSRPHSRLLSFPVNPFGP